MTNLRELAVAAPPGPWDYDPNSDSYSGSISNKTGFLIEGEFYGGHAVAKYIAACSPDVIIAKLDEIDELRERLAELECQHPVAYRLTENRGNGKTEFTYVTEFKGAYLDNCLEVADLFLAAGAKHGL
jgi:hypothetical protein